MFKIVKNKKKVLISILMVAFVAAFNINITNSKSSNLSNLLTLNSFVQIAYASGEISDEGTDYEDESGWSRFWNNIGGWIDNAWDDVCGFLKWGNDFANEVKDTYNNCTEWDTNWAYIDVDPYGNPFKYEGGIKITLTPHWENWW